MIIELTNGTIVEVEENDIRRILVAFYGYENAAKVMVYLSELK